MTSKNLIRIFQAASAVRPIPSAIRAADDAYTQAGNLFRLMPAEEKDRLTTHIAHAMRGVAVDIQQRQLAHFDKADPAYGAGVRTKLALHKALATPA
jgi:catalase